MHIVVGDVNVSLKIKGEWVAFKFLAEIVMRELKQVKQYKSAVYTKYEDAKVNLGEEERCKLTGAVREARPTS